MRITCIFMDYRLRNRRRTRPLYTPCLARLTQAFFFIMSYLCSLNEAAIRSTLQSTTSRMVASIPIQVLIAQIYTICLAQSKVVLSVLTQGGEITRPSFSALARTPIGRM
ncbi:hypothetical protein K504DRAFT_113642 [Pleomassaria siparia CBS 279.74]|uniref:Uncharacterized protein n=1 Tax=Pleomassaria siparia CBS 279.74 TaxID=1314801 RepID=A0A6G1JW70_9PLEO|nr:hypothetical protein K504DRAFT_113642 [Pleomassaria siparia CBS 279.74]